MNNSTKDHASSVQVPGTLQVSLLKWNLIISMPNTQNCELSCNEKKIELKADQILRQNIIIPSHGT